jgi:hypothetical protein
MLIYSMGVSVDGFIADREGAFEWAAPSAAAVVTPRQLTDCIARVRSCFVSTPRW